MLHKKIIYKTITWRIVASLSTFIIAIIFTNKLGVSIGISLFEAISKTILYYTHELAWREK